MNLDGQQRPETQNRPGPPKRKLHRTLRCFLFTGLCLLPNFSTAAQFRVATYNLENYLESPTASRPAKSEQAKSKVRESIVLVQADVLGLQEIGGTNALLELRTALQHDGVDYPYWELVSGYDTNIQVAVLSKLPIVGRRPHSSEGFLLNGRRFRLTRGIAELDIRVTPEFTFTLFVVHLKSRRPSPEADEADLREQEAMVLREKIDAALEADPRAHLMVIGDLNDSKEARSTRVILGKGRHALVDTRPAERNGDDQNGYSRSAARNVTWTHFYWKDDTYSRLDYILLSREMARSWEPAASFVVTMPHWGEGSDHRPVVAAFSTH